MPRKPGVWQRKAKDGKPGPWYTWLDGRRVRLAEPWASAAEARVEHAKVLLGKPRGDTRNPDNYTVGDVLQFFAQRCHQQVKDGERELNSFLTIKSRCEAFGKYIGHHRADELKEHQIDEAIRKRATWKSPATKAGGKQTIRSAFRWAKQVGHLGVNPLADMRVTTAPRREALVSREEGAAILAEVKGTPVYDALRALWLTGCRPGELYGLTAADVDFERRAWSVIDKNRRKTGKRHRLVPVSPDALELSRGLAAVHPKGPLFRNGWGKAWTNNGMRYHLVKASKAIKIGRTVVAYEFRHLWATDAIAAGVSPALVAQVLGHKDWQMLAKHYVHFEGHLPALHAAVDVVRPGGQS